MLMDIKEESRFRHDQLSGTWSDNYYGRRFPGNMDQYDIWKRHRLFRQFLSSIGSVDRALEVGCGTGDNIAVCDARIRDAIDVSEKMIVAARKIHEGVNFSVGDVLDINPATKYDLIICLGVIQYVADFRRLLDTLTNAVESGGHLILSFPNRNSLFRSLYYRRYGNANRQNDYAKADVCGYLEQQGFTVLGLKAHSSALPGTGRFFAPLSLATTIFFDNLYSIPGLGAMADRIAYSYIGLFRMT